MEPVLETVLEGVRVCVRKVEQREDDVRDDDGERDREQDGTRNSSFRRENLGHPARAHGDERDGAVTPDPSLPTTGSRDRGSPSRRSKRRGRGGPETTAEERKKFGG